MFKLTDNVSIWTGYTWILGGQDLIFGTKSSCDTAEDEFGSRERSGMNHDLLDWMRVRQRGSKQPLLSGKLELRRTVRAMLLLG